MARVKINPVLLISPLDPACQSGLVKDAIILHQLGKTSIAICTAVANQNDIEIDDLTLLSFEEIKRQLDAIGRRYWLDWAVISGVQELNLVAAIIRHLEQKRPGIKILWSPALQHTGRAYREQLNNQEQELFQTLCNKIHIVFLTQQDLLLFPLPASLSLINQWSETYSLYLAGDEKHSDALYIAGTCIEQPDSLAPACHGFFLPALASSLYDGNEINEACSQARLFLSKHSIN